MQTLQLTLGGDIAWLRLHRPPVHALDAAALQALCGMTDELGANPPRVLAIVGGGSRYFSAGADVKAIQHWSPSELGSYNALFQQAVGRVADLPVAVVAALNGDALGGGLELALAADFRVAADHVRLGLPEGRLGLLPCGGGTQRLGRLCGEALARDLLLTGRLLTAGEALARGLLTRVVPGARLEDAVRDLAAEVAQMAPRAVAAAKAALRAGMDAPLAAGLGVELGAALQLAASLDYKEGIRALLAHERPRFRRLGEVSAVGGVGSGSTDPEQGI